MYRVYRLIWQTTHILEYPPKPNSLDNVIKFIEINESIQVYDNLWNVIYLFELWLIFSWWWDSTKSSLLTGETLINVVLSIISYCSPSVQCHVDYQMNL
jgi:hypothetical protein